MPHLTAQRSVAERQEENPTYYVMQYTPGHSSSQQLRSILGEIICEDEEHVWAFLFPSLAGIPPVAPVSDQYSIPQGVCDSESTAVLGVPLTPFLGFARTLL